MATSKMSMLVDGGGKKNTKPQPLNDEQLMSFGNFAGSPDTKETAKYLMKKGLVGAEQLYTDHPDITKKEGIINSQSDWKPAAISHMLIRARQLGLKTPTEISANKEAIMGSMPDRLKQALSHPTFAQIHPNFWPVFNDILKDRYDTESKPQLTLIAKK